MKSLQGMVEALRVIVWLAFLLSAVALLVWLGEDPRWALPPAHSVASADTWRRWLAARDIVDAVVAVARAALTMVGSYLLVLVGLTTISHLTGWVRPAAWARRLAVPLARGVVQSSLGVSVLVTTLSTPAGATTAGGARPAATADDDAVEAGDVPLLRRLPDSTAGASRPDAPDAADLPDLPGPPEPPDLPTTPPRGPASATPTPPAVRQPPPPVVAPPGPGSPDVADSPTADGRERDRRTAPDPADDDTTQQQPDAPASERPAVWTVRPGDHFWSIAEEVVGGPSSGATTREVRRYWRELVRLNRAELVDPGNPDYILPGQRLALPPTARLADTR